MNPRGKRCARLSARSAAARSWNRTLEASEHPQVASGRPCPWPLMRSAADHHAIDRTATRANASGVLTPATGKLKGVSYRRHRIYGYRIFLGRLDAWQHRQQTCAARNGTSFSSERARGLLANGPAWAKSHCPTPGAGYQIPRRRFAACLSAQQIPPSPAIDATAPRRMATATSLAQLLRYAQEVSWREDNRDRRRIDDSLTICFG